MEILFTLNLLLAIANAAFTVVNYYSCNYKIMALNSFAAGCGAITILVSH